MLIPKRRLKTVITTYTKQHTATSVLPITINQQVNGMVNLDKGLHF